MHIHTLFDQAVRQADKAESRLSRTEVHTYAFSVAANVILSLFPFIVLLLTLSDRLFHSPGIREVVADMMKTFLPTGQDFVMRNMEALAHPRKGTQVFSVVMLLISSTGVFLPLEVALNRVWGVTRNRSYLHNQAVSLGLAFAVGVLAMSSIAMTAGQRSLLTWIFFGHTGNIVFLALSARLPAHRGCARKHPALLSHLLDPAFLQDSRTRRSAHGYCGRPLMGARQVSLRPGAAVARSASRLRPVLHLSRPHDVGLPLRPAPTCWGTLFRNTLHPQAGARG